MRLLDLLGEPAKATPWLVVAALAACSTGSSGNTRLTPADCRSDEIPAWGYEIDEAASCLRPDEAYVVACVPKEAPYLRFRGASNPPHQVCSGGQRLATWLRPEALPDGDWEPCDADEPRPVVLSCDAIACAIPIMSACTVEEVCALEDCGGTGALDDQGCRRPMCVDDGDCPEGTTCSGHGKTMNGVVCGRTPEGTCACGSMITQVPLGYCL